MSRSNSREELWCVSFRRAWCHRLSFFHFARRRRRKHNIRKESSPSSKVESERVPRFRNRSASSELREGDSELGSEEEDEEAGARSRTTSAACSSSWSPPKNALLLTRSRSAPYRSSSSACRFWGSPLDNAVEAQSPQQYGEESAVEEPKPLSVSEGESRVHPEEEEEEENVVDDEEEERFLKKETTVAAAQKIAKPDKIDETHSEAQAKPLLRDRAQTSLGGVARPWKHLPSTPPATCMVKHVLDL